MATPKRKRYSGQRSSQQYDTTFKDWIGKEARDVLPLFIPGATYEETLDVEIVRPTMRADKVFKGKYQGEDSIFNVELKMYDPLWEEHPKVKKIRVESEVQALRGAIVTVVKVRYPELGEMAQQKVEQINTPEVLKFLLAQISAEPEEMGVRSLLRPTAA